VAARTTQKTEVLNAAQALDFIERHGVAAESVRRGAVPSLAETIVGEAIRGNWWSHPRAKEIFAITRAARDAPQILVCRIVDGKMMVMLNRGDYWQCGYLIRKDEFENIKARGLEQFRNDVVSVAPFVADRTNELANWDPIKLLTVRIDRLMKWYRPGLLCIGDAAHAMSPIGGVGINLAIQDAVAAANILAERLLRNTVSLADLERVQLRRDFPTRMTQSLQIILQNNVIHRVLGNPDFRLPSVMKLLNRWPFLRRIPARIVGIGFRAEHVKTTNMYDPKRTSRADRIRFSDWFPFELLFWFLPWR